MYKWIRKPNISTEKWNSPKKFLSVIVTLLPIAISAWALMVSRGARDIAHTVAGLDLHPKLEPRTSLNPSKNYCRCFNIRKAGPINALQLEIHLISYRYEIKNGKERMISGFGSEERYQLEGLSSFKDKTFSISDYFLDVNARWEKTLQHNILEIRISYRRQPDMKIFTESAYYFINPEGKWVSENDGSLTPEIYNPIQRAVLSPSKATSEFLLQGEAIDLDPLHYRKNNKSCL